jgi:hypothetical protein
MKAKQAKDVKFEEVPLRVCEATSETLADYSVALGLPKNPDATKFEIHASGVLVSKGKRFGVLTARHSLPSRNIPVLLIIKCSQRVVIPAKALNARALGVPEERQLEPDLGFLEILPGPQLRAIQAMASFWPLDQDAQQLRQEYAKTGTPLTVIGFPEGAHETHSKGKGAKKILQPMAFFFGLGSGGVSERDGWDYVEANSVFNGKNEPDVFKGVSSGPLWGLRVTKPPHSRRYDLAGFALIGMAFLHLRITKSRVLARAHFINSIYERAWKK